MTTLHQNAGQHKKMSINLFMTVQIYEFYIKWIFMYASY